MSDNKGYSDIFDDDFEVTYEEESGIYDDDRTMTVPIQKNPRRSDRYADASRRYTDDTSDDIYEDDDDGYGYDEDSDDNSRYDGRYDDRYDDDAYDDRKRSSRRKSRGVPLAAPIRKGGRTLSRLASAAVRSLTAVLILAIIIYGGSTFWRASTPYGDIMEMIRTWKPSLTLGAYLCVAALFLIFELIALLWSMTRVRVRDRLGTYKQDTGRGLFSFILVFATSYLAFFLSPFIPEAPEAVYGVKGALDVYGSMHNVFFGLCAAGVISCIVRKYFS